jgi:hypothetical protein
MNALSDLIPDLTFTGAFGADWLGIGLIALLSFALGFALNRGSICTVIATADLVARRRPARSIALLESALWAGLVYALLNVSPFMPEGWLPLGYLVVGTVLFAVGSYVNGACVFGSIGHFGNGDVEFALVFVGIFIVKYIEPLTNLLPAQPPLSMPLPGGALPLAGILALLMLARLAVTHREKRNFGLLSVTMAAVGLTFALLVTFTPLFSITASIETIISVPVAGAVTIAGMCLGSIASAALRERRFMIQWPTWQGGMRHLAGGMLMGLGAVLIPGGNDTLLLVGLPGAAWQAFVSYALLVAVLAGLIAVFGTRTRAWT